VPGVVGSSTILSCGCGGTKSSPSQPGLTAVGSRFGAAEQADAADEGRLEAGRSILVGVFRGSVVIVNCTRRSRPSQLIRSVGRTISSATRVSHDPVE
jgi:hypothetical protein